MYVTSEINDGKPSIYSTAVLGSVGNTFNIAHAIISSSSRSCNIKSDN